MEFVKDIRNLCVKMKLFWCIYLRVLLRITKFDIKIKWFWILDLFYLSDSIPGESKKTIRLPKILKRFYIKEKTNIVLKKGLCLMKLS